MYSQLRGQTLWLIRRTHGSVEAGWDSTGVSPGCCIKILKYRTNEHHFEVIFFGRSMVAWCLIFNEARLALTESDADALHFEVTSKGTMF